MKKAYLKKKQEELTEYLQFRRRGSVEPAKKGKGAPYKRDKTKDMVRDQSNLE